FEIFPFSLVLAILRRKGYSQVGEICTEQTGNVSQNSAAEIISPVEGDGGDECARPFCGYCESSGMARTLNHCDHEALRPAKNKAGRFADVQGELLRQRLSRDRERFIGATAIIRLGRRGNAVAWSMTALSAMRGPRSPRSHRASLQRRRV